MLRRVQSRILRALRKGEYKAFECGQKNCIWFFFALQAGASCFTFLDSIYPSSSFPVPFKQVQEQFDIRCFEPLEHRHRSILTNFSCEKKEGKKKKKEKNLWAWIFAQLPTSSVMATTEGPSDAASMDTKTEKRGSGPPHPENGAASDNETTKNEQPIISEPETDEDPKYPPLKTVALVMGALYIAMFLVSLVSRPPASPLLVALTYDKTRTA